MNPLATSCVPKIAWPALPTASGAQMLAMQWQLQQSQWWPREQLLAHQFRQVRALLAHAIRYVPFYEGMASHAGIANISEVDETSFRRWPILRKSDIRANEEKLRAREYPKAHGSLLQSETTGSTGMPIRVWRTQLERFFAGALVVREHLLHRRDFGLKLGTIRAGVKEGRQSGWGVVSGAFQTGPACAISLYDGIERQMDWLLRERPAYLLCTPASLRELVLLSRRLGKKPDGLRTAMTFAAMLPSDLKSLLREAWGVEVTDSYSCTEAATLAVQCPGYGHYLVQAENVYLEILREDGTPCEPGEMGRVIITALHNFAMPLIRYDLGDYAELGGACPTGRGLPTLNRIAGRVRNMLRDPTGKLVSPNIHASLWLDTPITQVRLLQRTLTEIDIEYVAERPLGTQQQEHLAATLQAALNYPFTIGFVRREYIPRQPGGKFEEFLSLLPESRA